jgi:serine/threonine protein kinase
MFKGAPPAAIDLLQRMIEFNPRKRITVDEALSHEFLALFRESLDGEVSRDLYNSSMDGNLNMEIEKMPLLVSDDIKTNVSSPPLSSSLPHRPQMKREILAYY